MKHSWLFIVLVFAFAKAYSQEISPQTSIVDVQKIAATLELNVENETISGKVNMVFKMLENANEVSLDAKNMQLKGKTAPSQIRVTATKDNITFFDNFKKGKRYEVFFSYEATPRQAAYFVKNETKTQFWTQGQGKYTSHWLPSIDDMNDKIEFDISLRHSTEEVAVSNGRFSQERGPNGSILSTFDMEKPISSYLVGLVLGEYLHESEISSSGIPLEYYYYPEDSLKVASTYKYSKQIFNFLESEIGVPFPFATYKQVPVKDFLYAGMENASCTIFSDNFMVDSIGFTDRNYVNVNAHELAHQWFGDLVTETKSEHHWLQEGFATYYALLAEREIFGDDYFYFKLFETAEQLRELSDQGKGEKLLSAGGSSLTYYQKGAWALHILKEKVGEDAFAKAVQSYLKKYAYQNVTTTEFMAEVASFTEIDLSDFKKNWLNQSAFQSEDALQALKKSKFMQQYFELQSARMRPLSSKYIQLMDAIESCNDYLGQEAIYQISDESTQSVLPIYKKAIESSNIYIRQGIATSLNEVPEQLEKDFHKLLSDSSYVTKEQAFFKLWVYYKQRNNVKAQHKLLDFMGATYGFADGNIRTLWLTLSLATPNFKPHESVTRYQELIDYTDPAKPYQLRENAFRYLNQLQSFEKQSLKNLVEASVHHVWRFRENSRKLLSSVLSNTENQHLLESIKKDLTGKELDYLQKIKAL
ncbi:M1 family metallopeptidase [Dokdonia sp. Hel_I_53]|uniref:M1 family metallopeptidase n=1 Tax=Dokdonia sp. Hel_I_53 TaxID=1566287 RepID=UPI00119BA141|nr:M1 family metallopeptidase [Dokdonia sp. Hel_I_53]TVZ51041.1 aminopeptidase N [Dokdonia sp. Hel_I_53]